MCSDTVANVSILVNIDDIKYASKWYYITSDDISKSILGMSTKDYKILQGGGGGHQKITLDYKGQSSWFNQSIDRESKKPQNVTCENPFFLVKDKHPLRGCNLYK